MWLAYGYGRSGKKFCYYPPPPHWICQAYDDPGKFLLLPPPPTESARLTAIPENFCYYPPPTECGRGLRRSRKIGSWLRRCQDLNIQHIGLSKTCIFTNLVNHNFLQTKWYRYYRLLLSLVQRNWSHHQTTRPSFPLSLSGWRRRQIRARRSFGMIKIPMNIKQESANFTNPPHQQTKSSKRITVTTALPFIAHRTHGVVSTYLTRLRPPSKTRRPPPLHWSQTVKQTPSLTRIHAHDVMPGLSEGGSTVYYIFHRPSAGQFF